jgi:threonine dehydrogenase-like Zn-dependent dehydrogenase
MRAARYYGKKDIRIEQIPEPEVKKGQLKVRNAAHY